MSITDVTVLSYEPFDYTKFESCDFYDTIFCYQLNFLLLHWQENMIDTEDILEMLRDNDYVKINIKCNDKNYIIYHCFCGDNPTGLIVNDFTILEQIGETTRELNILHGDLNVQKIVNWYYSTTKNCTTYDEDYWYANQIHEQQ